MEWRKPEFEDINMSAEIGSYQEDEGGRYPGAGPRLESMPRPETLPDRDAEAA